MVGLGRRFGDRAVLAALGGAAVVGHEDDDRVLKLAKVLDDVEEAAGMLLGMVAAAPQRAAIYGGVPLPSRAQIEARARACAALFLRGCGTAARKPLPPINQ